jgi:tetratricopeptide (TPR) repeat protein
MKGGLTIAKQSWEFKSRFRAKAYGWKGSSLAIKRLKEAVSEIKKVARTDALVAADGAVTLFERFWPALEHIDTSSGALGGAVNWTQEELLPLVIAAPADRKTRDKWLDRLWQAIQDDGVDYLCVVQDHWGDLCASPEVASHWADQFVDLIRMAWSDPRPGGYVNATSLCLSSLVAAGRHQDIWDLLAIARFPFWHYRKFGVDALVKEGRIEEAVAYAEASRGLNQPDRSIDSACERILLAAGRADEAYERYALTASETATGLATFRSIANKYPHREPSSILLDLAESSGETGRYFAAAKDAGFYDLALKFAGEGRTDPRTLSRASRDFAAKEPTFAMTVGRLALERLLLGHGYEIISLDVLDSYRHFVAAAEKLGLRESALRDAMAMANLARLKQPSPLADAVLRAITDASG